MASHLRSTVWNGFDGGTGDLVQVDPQLEASCRLISSSNRSLKLKQMSVFNKTCF